MENQELLQAIGQMMDEKLEAERNRTAQMLDEKLRPLDTKIDKMQKDIDHITKQVDIAYKWVDMIDLRVRALERG